VMQQEYDDLKVISCRPSSKQDKTVFVKSQDLGEDLGTTLRI